MHFEYACSQQGPLRTPFERHCTNLFSPTFSSSLRYLIHLLKPVPCPMHLQSVPCLQCHYQLVLCQWTLGRQVLMTYRHHQLVPCYCQHLGMSTVEEGLEQLVPATLLTGNYSIQTTHAAMLCYVTLRQVTVCKKYNFKRTSMNHLVLTEWVCGKQLLLTVLRLQRWLLLLLLLLLLLWVASFYRMDHLQWPWVTSDPDFKVMIFFDTEYLRNDTR